MRGTTLVVSLLLILGTTFPSAQDKAATASVTYDSTKTNPDTLAKAITKKTGFPAKARADQ